MSITQHTLHLITMSFTEDIIESLIATIIVIFLMYYISRMNRETDTILKPSEAIIQREEQEKNLNDLVRCFAPLGLYVKLTSFREGTAFVSIYSAENNDTSVDTLKITLTGPNGILKDVLVKEALEKGKITYEEVSHLIRKSTHHYCEHTEWE